MIKIKIRILLPSMMKMLVLEYNLDQYTCCYPEPEWFSNIGGSCANISDVGTTLIPHWEL